MCSWCTDPHTPRRGTEAARLQSRVTRAVVAVVLLSSVSVRAQAPVTLQNVRDRLTHYLTDYAEQLPATLASEHYEQRTGRIGPGERVVLESEFGIMRLGGPGGWLGVRDIVSVNGRPVADHEQRLQALFTNPSAQVMQQARQIAQENARFNVGPIQRTINDPAIVLEILDGRNASRMRFTRAGAAPVNINGLSTWAIRYEERRRPTIVETPDGDDLPVRGTAWVEPETGRLAKAEVTIERESTRIGFMNRVGFTATVTVTFKDDPSVGFWVPSELNERYLGRNQTSAFGAATYSNYRKFSVDTRVIVSP
jgi:hypothetical protein